SNIIELLRRSIAGGRCIHRLRFVVAAAQWWDSFVSEPNRPAGHDLGESHLRSDHLCTRGLRAGDGVAAMTWSGASRSGRLQAADCGTSATGKSPLIKLADGI